MIVIINQVGTNIASLQFACERLGKSTKLSGDPKDILKASHILLPGVSTAYRAMKQLVNTNLVGVLSAITQPVLGICSGMQILCDWSEEGAVDGLGIFHQKVTKLCPSTDTLHVPHMGWNTLNNIEKNCPLLQGITDGCYVYYTHSFATGVSEHTMAETEYTKIFSAVVANNNFFGTQFHPERSGSVGTKILSNFLSM